MAVESSNLTVDNSKHQFQMEADGETAFIDFTRAGNIITLVHTEAPEKMQGQGVGSALVKKTLQYIDEHNLKVIPQCKFVKSYIDKHPDWNKLIAQ